MATEELESFRVFIAEYKTTLSNKFKKRKKWVAPNKNHILAVIPGTVLEINVKVGDKIEKGETILILEAMKMANNIAMPFSGSIKKINVAPGQTLAKNHVMIEIE